jgi:cytochrome c biogenesis protein CcmG, thiol:disulfide interchange protein DsbE
MRKSFKWIIVSVASILLGLFASWIGFKKQVHVASTTAAAIPRQGYRMPSITLTEYPDNKTIRTDDLVGKPVFINFWASWCSPCKQETPDIVKAYKRYGNQVVFLSVNATSEDTMSAMEKFVKDYSIVWHVVLDKKGSALNTYNVLGLPTSVFVNRQGIITNVHLGLISNQNLNTNLQEILK